ncbi:hypothetical protein AJ80_08984 [Polytolypa hystricis UAMH7299]|uniref:Uncharacterized protein n=1 Tax=Polytolypa hystricis (strain UAMH7299) TaxID=1447883 RepID=A0A2B7WY73_POLH7|nr:hypothetical protein AJ80_08984 [Polytolypa hystricis UAMH7299]
MYEVDPISSMDQRTGLPRKCMLIDDVHGIGIPTRSLITTISADGPAELRPVLFHSIIQRRLAELCSRHWLFDKWISDVKIWDDEEWKMIVLEGSCNQEPHSERTNRERPYGIMCRKRARDVPAGILTATGLHCHVAYSPHENLVMRN